MTLTPAHNVNGMMKEVKIQSRMIGRKYISFSILQDTCGVHVIFSTFLYLLVDTCRWFPGSVPRCPWVAGRL